jgi:hypothetical protein
MIQGFLGSIVVLLASAGLALAQAPATMSPTGDEDRPLPTPDAKATQLPAPSAVNPDKPASSDSPDKPNPAWSDFPLWTGGDGSGSPGHFYVIVDYLLAWTKSDRVPPLVTTGPPSSEGILGNPGTMVLFGGSDLNTGTRSGINITAGVCLSECLNLGLQTNFFGLFPKTQNPVFRSDQFPVLGRPFIVANPPGGNLSQIATFPNLSTGSISVANSNRFWGGETNLCHPLCCCECSCWKVALQAGFRYLNLREDLTIRESILVNPNLILFPQFAPLAGSRIDLVDRFSTVNDFYGPQIGASADYWWGQWVLSLRGKLAIGATYEKIEIDGRETVTPPGGQPTTFVGGLLALSSNIGVFSRHRFAVVPEVGADIGYWFNCHVGAFVGGSFLYWSNVVRPGDQIDQVIDVTRIPNFPVTGFLPTGQARPAVLFKETDFWATRLNFGLVFSW